MFASFYDPNWPDRNEAVGGPDPQKAIELYKEAYEQGKGWAANRIARLYLFPEKHPSLTKDLAKALLWFQRGHELGDSSSTQMLASFYDPSWADRNEVAGGPNPQKAIQLYEEAFEKGKGWAANRIARLYLFPKENSSLTKDVSKALLWFQRGHELGHTDSSAMLGSFYLPFDHEWARERNESGGRG